MQQSIGSVFHTKLVKSSRIHKPARSSFSLAALAPDLYRSKAAAGSPALRKMFDAGANAARLNELLAGL